MKNSLFTLSLAALVAVAGLAAVGCGPAKTEPPAAETAAPAPAAEPAAAPADEGGMATAVTTFEAAEGHPVTGSVVFTQEGDQVHVVADVSGVVRAGLHGFHLHATGDCSAHDYTSAGGHFNPGNAPHGCPGNDVRHAGDFGNILIADDGTGTLDITTDQVTVTDGPNSVVGKAVILHEGEDDCTTQPTGNAGARLACAVVETAADMEHDMDAMGETSDDGGEGGEHGQK